ncbi:hypothetical protein I4U23_011384 [Adineta vaga]|nr:hypothetical protein I4U23_011384 [Adineta vaga]
MIRKSGFQFQCVNTTCLPFTIIQVSKIYQCQSACLAQIYCKAVSFHQPTLYCRLFDSILNQNINLLVADIETVTMITKTESRIPPEPTTTSTTTTSTSTSTTTTSTSTSTSTTTSSTSTTTSSTSTTTTTSSTSTTTSSTSTTTTTSSTSTTTTGPSTTIIITDPGNLGGYRGNNGQVYKFSITGTCSGSVWGTSIYTDDSYLSTAAVHAGYAQCGVATIVSVQVLPGQSSYTGSTQYGITSYSYGSFSGSYSFVNTG